MQLSPIQCTYSNIFIRFFKFFPANTNNFQNSYRVIGALCGLRQGVLSSQCGHLISFGTKYSVIARHRQRRCRGNPPEGNHIIKPPRDTFVLAWRKRRSVRRAEWEPLFVFPCCANFYCFLHNCQYDTLAKYMTDCDIFFWNHINH